jgi:hypothetical protein
MVAHLMVGIYREVVGRAVKLITRRIKVRELQCIAHTNSRSAGHHRALNRVHSTSILNALRGLEVENRSEMRARTGKHRLLMTTH